MIKSALLPLLALLVGCVDQPVGNYDDFIDTLDTAGDDGSVDTATPSDDGGAGDDGATDDGAGDDGAGDDGTADDGGGGEGGDAGTGDDGVSDDTGLPGLDDGGGDDGGTGDVDDTGDTPWTPEVCDGVDNDGDGNVDEGYDTDGDGTADCYDLEACDGVDNDGDGKVDEGFDADADGVSDCYDIEYCDGVDNDGDGLVDEDDARDASTWYGDADGDGHGDAGTTTTACDEPEDYTDTDDDCDDASADVHPDAVEACDAVDNNCDTDTDEECEDECWDEAPCLTWFQANALGYLDVATSADGTSIQFTNVGPDQDICFDRALYTSDTTQAFFADEQLILDDVRLAPGETVDTYYASYTTDNDSHETYLGEYAWWCVELGQSTAKAKSYDYYGELPPTAFLEFADDDNDVDGDSKEDHVDWANSYGVQTQYSIWDYQADSVVLTAGKLAALDTDGNVKVTTLSRNAGGFDGAGTLYDTVPAGWTVLDMTPSADSSTTNADGSVTYAWDIEVDGSTNPTVSGGTVVLDQFTATYTLSRAIPVDKVYLELPEATVDYYDMATDRTSTSLPAAVFGYDYERDGSVECK